MPFHDTRCRVESSLWRVELGVGYPGKGNIGGGADQLEGGFGGGVVLVTEEGWIS